MLVQKGYVFQKYEAEFWRNGSSAFWWSELGDVSFWIHQSNARECSSSSVWNLIYFILLIYRFSSVISGSSIGSLVAGVVAVRTDVELQHMLDAISKEEVDFGAPFDSAGSGMRKLKRFLEKGSIFFFFSNDFCFGWSQAVLQDTSWT